MSEADHAEQASDGAATALVPRRQQTVDFYGDGIPVAEGPDGNLYVAVRPITDFLGLDFSAQRRRIQRDEVLTERARPVLMTAVDGRRRELLCIPLDLLPGWLFGVTTARTRPDLHDKLRRYRKDCFRVLWDAFRGEASPAALTEAPSLSGAVLALEIATAVQQLARQQLDMEQHLADVAGRQDVMADYLRGFIVQTNHRLSALESATALDATITEAQAAEIALAVKTVGQRLEARGDREGYAKIYSEMYRRYHITTYKALPAARYEEVREWLHSWYQELDPPA